MDAKKNVTSKTSLLKTGKNSTRKGQSSCSGQRGWPSRGSKGGSCLPLKVHVVEDQDNKEKT